MPRAAALISHVCIGTVAQGLAAGIPQLAVPMSHDQPDNAARLKKLGVGDWLAPGDVSGAAVAERLAALLDSAAVRARCRELAGRIDFDEALSAAIQAIEAVAPHNTG